MSRLNRRAILAGAATVPALALSVAAAAEAPLPPAAGGEAAPLAKIAATSRASQSDMERAIARLLAIKERDATLSGDDEVAAVLHEEGAAEWEVIRMPANSVKDIRQRALVVRQILRDAEELGEPDDNRHHAALDALVSDIFSTLLDGLQPGVVLA